MVLELGFKLPNFEMINANSSKNEYFNSHNLDNRHLLLMLFVPIVHLLNILRIKFSP